MILIINELFIEWFFRLIEIDDIIFRLNSKSKSSLIRIAFMYDIILMIE